MTGTEVSVLSYENVPFPEDARKAIFAKEYLRHGRVRPAYIIACPGKPYNGTLAYTWLRELEESGYMDTLRRDIMNDTRITLRGHLEELANLRDLAKDDGKYAAAIAAEIARGKAAGLYEDVSRNDPTRAKDPGNMSLDEIDKQLAEMRKLQESRKNGLGSGTNRTADFATAREEES